MKKTSVSVRVSAAEKELFIAVARDVDVPHIRLMRNLVRYVLKDEIAWTELLKKFKELSADATPERDYAGKAIMRTELSPELHAAFVRLAEEWGSTTNTILKRLILLYTAGKIERHAIFG